MLSLVGDQLYDGAGKAIALQVKITICPTEACCEIGLVVINGLTVYKNNETFASFVAIPAYYKVSL